jgi:Fe-S cluster biosynthesis and repair protein YggX
MTDLDRRIAQFANMAQADPDNEMAHFSLAKALFEAGRFEESAASYLRCTELAPQMSKAFQMAAEAYVKAGKSDLAAQIATRGFTIAAERGDLMPRNAMADLLRSLGKDVPEVAGVAGKKAGGGGDMDLLATGPVKKYTGPIPAGAFVCSLTGRPGTKMDRAPFRGPVGEWIQANITKETFATWIAQGTKVINELRLDLSRQEDEDVYDQHMREFLGIDEELYGKLMAKAGG